jgi:hypothetical protein
MENDESIRRLLLFNEKVEKVLRCSFVKNVFTKDHGFTLHVGQNQPITVERHGSDEEATDAISLTLRFFFIDKDGLSIYNAKTGGVDSQMESLYLSLSLPEAQKQSVRDAFAEYRDFLAGTTSIKCNNQLYTNWFVLEHILFGDLSHANPEKRPIIEQWRAFPPLKSLIDFYYEDVVAQTVIFVSNCRNFNNYVIHYLSGELCADHSSSELPSIEPHGTQED